MIPLSWYLIFSIALFSIGFFGVLSRKNSVAILMSIELMLNAAIVNLLVFWRYLEPASTGALVFVVVIFAVAAAETAVALALIVSVYRRRQTVYAEDVNLMKG